MRSRLMLRFSFLTLLLVAFSAIVTSCDDDDEHVDQSLEGARLTDFQLVETDYISIDISHPVIVDGVETSPGAINIVVPYAQESLSLSLLELSLDVNVYSISPSAGIPQDFSEGPVTYTISLNETPSKIVHYVVTIVHGGEAFYKNAKVTGFKFEKSKNPSLAADIEALRIVEYENYSQNAIYVIVPNGTDFSALKPTIEFDAAKLYYDNASSFLAYPENGLTIDFKYPKHFYLQAENSLGVKSRPYNVIVEVADPIAFSNPVLVTQNVKTGNGSDFENLFAVAEWTNQGNHPITGMSPIGYENRVAPDGFPNDLNVITTSLINPVIGTTGVVPGGKGKVDVRVRKSPMAGEYRTTAIFRITFSFDITEISSWPVDDRVEDIFNVPKLTIETTIEE